MLILHVGLPRCASTSLQVFFSDSVFQKYPSPIVYPSTGLNPLTSAYGHSSSLRYDSIDEHSLFVHSSLDSDLLDELKDLSSRQSPILISSEDLWRCDPEDIRASLSSAIDISMVRVVAIKRPWLEWIFSLYCHNRKQLAGQGISFSGWVHTVSLDVSYMRLIGKYSIYDHDRLKYISDIFNNSLVILPFPASGNTLHVLGKAAGITEIPNEWKRYHLPRLNASSRKDK